jgi:hypothetical protein
MKGTVTQINRKNGLCSIEIERNSNSIFEILESGNINIGDIISGELQESGYVILKNESKNVSISGVLQNYDCTENQLSEQLKL